jgi:isoleucyl-tRNA synthetase
MTPSDVDLKKTVNLLKTDFPMKASLPTRLEPELLKRWDEEDLYGQIRKSRAGAPKYILHDGPPYANGNIHLGHAFNKTLKDFIVKSKTMAGFDSPYVPGWDCHGLPIEIKVDSELGGKKAKMSTAEIRRACRKYADKYVNLQREDFKRLGVFGDWDNSYITMSPRYQAVIAGAFVDFLDKGYVYKGLKPVNWCPTDRTALAEAEVEYENHTSPSIWVRFALRGDAASVDSRLGAQPLFALIWTTTPWTLPANLAIAFHPRFPYSIVRVHEGPGAGGDYIIARDLVDNVATTLGWSRYEVVASDLPGKQFERLSFQHPFLDRESLGIVGDHVTLEQGSGAVHTAPGHGQEDYVAGMQYGLPVYCPVDATGRLFQAEGAAGEIPAGILGKTIWEANPVVIDILQYNGALLGQQKLEHSYPHCWRCHKPTIFRATEQWFIGMERNDLRSRTLEHIKGVKWMPAWGEERISNMIATRPDWCISRQRIWGVPIVAFYCEGCQTPLTDRKYLDPVVKLFEEHTADIWYEKTPDELLPEGTVCPKCGSSVFTKEKDILDVWFDSGSSHLAVLQGNPDLAWPSDMYLEGGDQYRGWFHSSLLIGVGLKGASPYRECLTNGWTLDGEGRAMSKSLGNVIEPEKIIKQHGAEVLRLWVASVEFNEDVRLSDTILTRLTEAYRKLRNTFRYALGNLSDFDPEVDSVPVDQLDEVDQWILWRTDELIAKCRAWYDEYAFHRVYRAAYDFATTDLSAVYFDTAKDRLYTAAPRSPRRRSAQTALYRVTYVLARLLAPILTFTTEEVWGHLPLPAGAPRTVHISLLPAPGECLGEASESLRNRMANWPRLMEVRDSVLKRLDEARQQKLIGAPLEAAVTLRAGGDLYNLLQSYGPMLPDLFIVSHVTLEEGEGDLAVSVDRAAGHKCERCWKYKADVGSDSDYPTICASCSDSVREILAA